MKLILRTSGILIVLFLTAGQPAQAQAPRTWVSGVGDDANPCSRTAPCKTFPGAISKTATNGEISVLDPGGYGAVTIVKSISIVAEGTEGSINACGTNAIIINAPAGSSVTLHGIMLEGCGSGLNGINIFSGGTVHIRKMLIRGFNSANGTGIFVQPGAAAKVHVSDTTVTKNTRGILVAPTGAGTADVFLDRVVVENNAGTGVRADGTAAGSRVFLNQTTVTNNGNGLLSLGGSIISFGNNAVTNNAAGNGPPTSTVPPI